VFVHLLGDADLNEHREVHNLTNAVRLLTTTDFQATLDDLNATTAVLRFDHVYPRRTDGDAIDVSSPSHGSAVMKDDETSGLKRFKCHADATFCFSALTPIDDVGGQFSNDNPEKYDNEEQRGQSRDPDFKEHEHRKEESERQENADRREKRSTAPEALCVGQALSFVAGLRRFSGDGNGWCHVLVINIDHPRAVEVSATPQGKSDTRAALRGRSHEWRSAEIAGLRTFITRLRRHCHFGSFPQVSRYDACPVIGGGSMPAPKATSKSATKPEEAWRRARLIPTTGIGGQDEQEERATSSLLAVMGAVPQFGRALLSHVGAPGGRIEAFTEIRFVDVDAKLSIPDGAVVVERGKARWICLIEVKTGGAELRSEQVERYLELARVNSFDAVLTISNQITASPSESPIAIDPKKLRKVALRHLSWWRVMTEARVEHKHRGISDPDQAWILGELIAYLDHERAGAGGFEDMGDRWVPVRDGARESTLKASDPGVRIVATRWEQLVEYLSLGLTQDLGRQVEPLWPKKLDPAGRRDLHVRSMVDQGKLGASIRVPNAAGPIDLEADLRGRRFRTSIVMTAPKDGRATTRINWMLRQLSTAKDDLLIEVRYPLQKEPTSSSLKEARAKPERLLYSADPKREPMAFRLTMSRDLGMKRGRLAGSFVLESKQQTSEFYRSIVQGLRAWAPAAPRLPSQAADATPVASPEPPPFTGSDREFGEAVEPRG
jgi:hypothetical protein